MGNLRGSNIFATEGITYSVTSYIFIYPMSKEQLETKLNHLRQKWIGHVPKSSLDPDWWNFKCDSVIATGLKSQIEELEKNGEASYEQAKAIFLS